MRDLDKYLQRRGDRWHYIRRIPEVYRRFDKRGTIRKSLKTTSQELARTKRDDLFKADDVYWQRVSNSEEETVLESPPMERNNAAGQRYKNAKKHAEKVKNWRTAFEILNQISPLIKNHPFSKYLIVP